MKASNITLSGRPVRVVAPTGEDHLTLVQLADGDLADRVRALAGAFPPGDRIGFLAGCLEVAKLLNPELAADPASHPRAALGRLLLGQVRAAVFRGEPGLSLGAIAELVDGASVEEIAAALDELAGLRLDAMEREAAGMRATSRINRITAAAMGEDVPEAPAPEG